MASMDTLSLLVSTPSPPPFIYIHHTHQPTTSLSLPPSANQARVDAIECYTPKILWSAIISRLEGKDAGLIDNLDTFIRRLKGAGKAGGRAAGNIKKSLKGKEKEKAKEVDEGRRTMSIVITKAERLPKTMGSGWAVMTRLSELAGIPLSVVLVSTVPWDELRPPRGDALEPVHIYIGSSSRENILRSLSSSSSHPLYPRFLDLILTTLLPLTSLASEIDYLSTMLWPIYTSILPLHLEQKELGLPYPDPDNPPPPLAITVKLLTDLKHQLSLPLTAAIENVLTRQIGRQEFKNAMIPSSSTSTLVNGMGMGMGRKVVPKVPALELPVVARYLLVAGYCASYNPAKSDLRLFGRATGPDRKAKKGGGTRRAGYGRVRIGKVPQRLQGPKPFPLDRLLAVFAALYAEHAPRPSYLLSTPEEEYDSDPSSDGGRGEYLTIAEQAAKAEKRSRKDTLKDDVWDEHVEHLTMSVKLWSMIPELEGQGLLRRVSPVDRLDNIMLRCEVDYETVKGLAKDLKIILDDYIYEAVQ